MSIGRAVEDTAVIMMTGAVVMAGIPTSILEKYEAIPFFIFYVVRFRIHKPNQMSYTP